MTDDFVADLEAELLAAARRRAVGTPAAPVRHRLRPQRPAWTTFARVVALLIALATAALGLVQWVRSDVDSATPAPPPGQGGELRLPAAVPAARCAKPSRPRTTPAPEELEQVLKVLRRRQHAPDGLPALNGGDGDDLSWLPVGDLDIGAVRRPGLERHRVEHYLVPSGRVRTDETCQGREHPHAGAGACLLIGAAGGPLATSCHTTAEIRGGRALALATSAPQHTANLFGIAPDGVSSVVIDGAGWRLAEATVVENTFQAVLWPGARPGERVRVRFRASPRTCRPPAWLLHAAPALRRAPTGPPPPVVERALEQVGARGASRAAARRAPGAGGDGLELWVAPLLRCDGARRDGAALVGIHRGRAVAFQEAGARELRRMGPSTLFPTDDGLGTAGFAPPGARAALVTVRGVEAALAVADGVYGAMLAPPAGRSATGDWTIRFRFRRPAFVGVVDGAGEPERALAALARVKRLGLPYIDTPVPFEARLARPGTRSAVYFRTLAAESIAAVVARELRVRDGQVRALPRRSRLQQFGADVIVVVGRDP